MRLFDETRSCVIADHLRMAGNFFERLRGLLGTRSLEPGEGLWIPRCQGIHTFGMRFAIDVIFLDKQMKAIRAVRQLEPNRAGPVEMSACSAIELPAGTLQFFHISEGDSFKVSE